MKTMTAFYRPHIAHGFSGVFRTLLWLLLFFTALPDMKASEVFTGPFVQLPDLAPHDAQPDTSATVRADVATMQDSTGTGPYWLTAWSESAPYYEGDGLLAPSAVFFRRMDGGVGAVPDAPVLLTRMAAAANGLTTVRGTGGAWVLCHSASDGLRAWWIPADAALPVPPPVVLWGTGATTPRFLAAGDGTFMWVWLATPRTGSPQERIAALEVQNGAPRLRRMDSSNRLPNDDTWDVSLCAANGRAVLAHYIALNGPNSTIIWHHAGIWSNNASYVTTYQSTDGDSWLGVVPWSNGEFLAVAAHALYPLSGVRLTGERFTAAGSAVPGAALLELGYAESVDAVLPLREGGLVPNGEGLILLNPGAPPVALPMQNNGHFPWTGADGMPALYATTISWDGRAVVETHGTSSSSHALLPPSVRGRRSAPQLSWAAEAISQTPLPTLSWKRSFTASDFGLPPQEQYAAAYQKSAGWLSGMVQPGVRTAARGSMFPGNPSLRTVLHFSESAGDIEGAYIVSDSIGTLSRFSVAAGPAAQSQPVIVPSAYGFYGAADVLWVEESIDAAGDQINKLRQASAAHDPGPVATRYITLGRMSGLTAGTGRSLVWTEGGQVFVGTVPESGGMLPIVASTAGGPIPASYLIGGNASLLLVADNYRPSVFTSQGGIFVNQGTFTPRMEDWNSAAVAGDAVFWIGHESGATSCSLYMQRFPNGVAGPVQMLPVGPVVPGQIAAATDTRGRYVVAVPVLDQHEPVLTVFALAAGVPAAPVLNVRRSSAEDLALSWPNSLLYPTQRPAFEHSTDLQHWTSVPDTAAARRTLILGRPEWIITHPPEPRYFLRLAAELVP